MGRKPTYDTNALTDFVNQYIRYKNDFRCISPTQIAEFCQKNLHVVITYQNFTRNKEVYDYIKKYNRRLIDHVTDSVRENIILDETTIDIDKVMDTVYMDPDLMRTYLKGVNKQICSLIDYCHKLSGTAEKLNKTLDINESLGKQITLLQAQLEKLRKENEGKTVLIKEQKEILREVTSYINNYLYDPIVLNHLKTIRILDTSEPVTAVPESARIITRFSGDINIINDFYDAIDEQKEETVSTHSNAGREIDHQDTTVLTKKEAEMLDMFSEL